MKWKPRSKVEPSFLFLLVAASMAAGLLWFDVPRLWRVVVFIPLWASAIGLFQVREKTCVALAARGLRNLDAGDEAIADPRELEQVRRQSRRVHAKALLGAGLLTLLTLMA